MYHDLYHTVKVHLHFRYYSVRKNLVAIRRQPKVQHGLNTEAPFINSGVELGNINEDRCFPVNFAGVVVISVTAMDDCCTVTMRPAEERDAFVEGGTVTVEAASGSIDTVREDSSCFVLAVNGESSPTVDLGPFDVNTVALRTLVED